MSNTFKFGNGKWATGQGSVLAYNDENGNFKPLPFDFTRASSATRVNENGLIEVVGSNEPRIDYLNNTSGHLLLEPSRTNIVTDSDDMSGWGNSNGATDLNSGTAPDGSNTAIKFKDDNSGGTNAVRLYQTYSVSTSTNYEVSAFMKAGSLNYGGLRTGGFTTPSNGDTIFNLVDGTIHSQHSGHTRASIEDYGNGWYRCSIGFTTDVSVSSGNIVVVLANNDGNPNFVPVDGTSNILIWGVQFEQGSYATSYIPTSGSAVTRQGDNDTTQPNTNSWDISSSFSMFFSFGKNVKSGGSSPIMTINTSGNNFQLYTNSSGNGGLNIYLDGQGGYIFGASGNDAMNSDKSKICITYNASTGRLAYFINGSLWNQQTSALSFGSLTNFVFSTAANTTILSIKENKLYTNALTDAEAIALTS